MRREATRRLKAAGFMVRTSIAGGRDGLSRFVNTIPDGTRYFISNNEKQGFAYTPGTAAEIISILDLCGYVPTPESTEGSILTFTSRGVPLADGTFADVWYDSCIRSWVLQIKDAQGNEIGSTHWSHAKPDLERLGLKLAAPAAGKEAASV
jgi:hypothetical protein